MDRVARLVFRNFWSVLALTCALGEWTLATWLLGWRVPVWGHALAVAGLFGLSRAAARWCERERHHAPVRNLVGRTALAVGFGSFLVAGLLGSAAIAWGAWALVVPVARAGAATLPGDPWVGFRPVADVAAAIGLLLVGWGYVVGPRWLRVTRRTVPIAGLPASFDGYTIAHLSDLHLGPLADRASLGRAFDLVTHLGVDLVCITGDIVDSPHCDLDAWMPELRRLAARDGVLAILGNHDRDADADAVAQSLARHASVRLLRDGVATVQRDGATLAVVGLEDRPPPDVAAALPAVRASAPAGATPILLVHHPDAFPDAVSAGMPLTLAGHTHGGQLAVPWFRHLNVAHLLVTSWDIGWFRTETHHMHVSPGLGVSGQQIRIGTRPEITIVRLACAAAAAAA